ncbi:MAG: TraR/DksA family transcriptional regulator [Acidimicrobiales bacterium]
MDQARARQLVDHERRVLEAAAADVGAELSGVEGGDAPDWSDAGPAETDEETDEAVAGLLKRRLAALNRAEERLAAGTYGRSVRSGAVIPDERLEADPLAELTAEEAASGTG